ncbi:hypothetical protein V1358_09870 [Pseudoalteromonas sp. YIC-656]|uniref:hypothetical protein n=1 Tax=Pseudoalteromonas pernae TaxID=3118054 RepID=UPI003242626B
MDEFPLQWRWTDEQHCILSHEELCQIQPLFPDYAKEIWDSSLNFIDQDAHFSPNSERFDSIEIIDAIESTTINSWLKAKMADTHIVVFWQPKLAVRMTSTLFAKYWDEFCYPSCDDVFIWPENGAWIIYYAHYEKFFFGKLINE